MDRFFKGTLGTLFGGAIVLSAYTIHSGIADKAKDEIRTAPTIEVIAREGDTEESLWDCTTGLNGWDPISGADEMYRNRLSQLNGGPPKPGERYLVPKINYRDGCLVYAED